MKRVEAWRESGQSVAAFCRSRDLTYSQFVYWQRRLRGEVLSLVPVVVAKAEPCSAAAAAVDLDLPNGVRVRLASVSIADVITLVRGLSC
jgi:hypothetical protein